MKKINSAVIFRKIDIVVLTGSVSIWPTLIPGTPINPAAMNTVLSPYTGQESVKSHELGRDAAQVMAWNKLWSTRPNTEWLWRLISITNRVLGARKGIVSVKFYKHLSKETPENGLEYIFTYLTTWTSDFPRMNWPLTLLNLVRVMHLWSYMRVGTKLINGLESQWPWPWIYKLLALMFLWNYMNLGEHLLNLWSGMHFNLRFMYQPTVHFHLQN